jgi:hypothetical protein
MMSYREMDTDILLLVANGHEHAAKERLRDMTPAEWRDLREAISMLDEWLDDVALERQQAHNRKVNP